MALAARRLFRFGPFRLDVDRRLLWRGSALVPLRPRVFDTLLALARRAGDVVSKDELLDAVWPDSVVEENNLNQNILALRRALECETSGEVRIETVPRRGFRLIADLEEELSPPQPASPADRPAREAVRAEPVRRPRHVGSLAAVVGLILIGVLGGGFWRLRTARSPMAGVRSIAVLPMRMLDATPSDEYLGLGLADAVTTRLGYVRSLRVRPTASVRALHATREPVAAGRALQVDAVLAGQIQKAGGRVRVTAQLIGTGDGSELWSETFDVKESDIFTLEDSVSEAVARALAATLSPGESQRVVRDRPTSQEAYEAYLQGRYFWNQRSEAGTQQARTLFEKAISLDPRYALAYAGLADALHYFPRPGDMERSRDVARRALALDDSLAEAHASLGNLALFTDWKFDEAEERFRRALDLNPSYATAHQWYAYCYLVRGDLSGASREIRRAREADPLSPSIGVDAALMLYYARRYDDAIAEFQRVLSLDPRFGQALQFLLLAFVEKGDLEGARGICSRPSSAAEGWVAQNCVAILAAHSGNRAEAEAAMSGITGPERWMTAAAVALALGDRDAALARLEDGYRLHSASALLLAADPLFDDLRGDPRFEDLLHRVGLRRPSG